MDLYSWVVLLVLIIIVAGIVYRENKRFAKKELEASKDIDEQFHFIDSNETEHEETKKE